MRDSATSGRRRASADGNIVPYIMVKGQGRYMTRHKAIGDRRNKGGGQNQSPSKDEKLDPLTIISCFNYDDPNHMVSDCPKQIDSTKPTQRKMEYYPKNTGNNRNAHVVLIELCHEMDSLSINSEEAEVGVQMSIESPDITDSGLFCWFGILCRHS